MKEAQAQIVSSRTLDSPEAEHQLIKRAAARKTKMLEGEVRILKLASRNQEYGC